MVRCARPPRHGVEYRPRNRPCDTRTVQARALLKRIRRAAVQVLSPPANQQSRGHPAAIVFYMAARPEDQRARATEASRCPTPLWPSRRRAPAVPPRISSAADSRQRPSAAVAHRTSAHEPPVFFRRGNQARQRRRLAPDLSLLRGDHGGRRDVLLSRPARRLMRPAPGGWRSRRARPWSPYWTARSSALPRWAPTALAGARTWRRRRSSLTRLTRGTAPAARSAGTCSTGLEPPVQEHPVQRGGRVEQPRRAPLAVARIRDHRHSAGCFRSSGSLPGRPARHVPDCETPRRPGTRRHAVPDRDDGAIGHASR